MFRQLKITLVWLMIIGFIYCETEDKSSCSANSSINVCGTICEPTCTSPNPEICAAVACTNETKDCRCDSGYLRDLKTQMCVLPFHCSECPPGQALLACGTTCEGTCQQPSEPEICQVIRCILPGCGCDLNQSMVRSNSTGKCVKIADCSDGD